MWVTPGSVLTTVLWLLASLAFKYYVTNFGAYTETYGAIGGVMVLLLWFYISGLVALLGAELNAEIEHASPYGKAAGEKVPGQRRAIGALAFGRYQTRPAPGRRPEAAAGARAATDAGAQPLPAGRRRARDGRAGVPRRSPLAASLSPARRRVAASVGGECGGRRILRGGRRGSIPAAPAAPRGHHDGVAADEHEEDDGDQSWPLMPLARREGFRIRPVRRGLRVERRRRGHQAVGGEEKGHQRQHSPHLPKVAGWPRGRRPPTLPARSARSPAGGGRVVVRSPSGARRSHPR